MDIISDDINRILYLLAEHKKNVSHLYNNYAIKFPERPYWKDLAAAKQKHCEIIQSIYFDVKGDVTSFDESVFHSAAIKTSLEWVVRLIAESDKHDILKALAYTLDLENSRIEQKYFDIFKTKLTQIDEFLPTIMAENEKYVSLLRQELQNIRQNSPLV
jgi:hypothetical protein